jgi:uncharacterized protein YhaN
MVDTEQIINEWRTFVKKDVKNLTYIVYDYEAARIIGALLVNAKFAKRAIEFDSIVPSIVEDVMLNRGMSGNEIEDLIDLYDDCTKNDKRRKELQQQIQELQQELDDLQD